MKQALIMPDEAHFYLSLAMSTNVICGTGVLVTLKSVNMLHIPKVTALEICGKSEGPTLVSWRTSLDFELQKLALFPHWPLCVHSCGFHQSFFVLKPYF